MVGWYARFIKNESSIKVPLVKLLHKSREWKWEEAQQEALETLKRALVMAPVPARPDFSKPFVVQCDASNFAIGAVLTHQGKDGEHPIVYGQIYVFFSWCSCVLSTFFVINYVLYVLQQSVCKNNVF